MPEQERPDCENESDSKDPYHRATIEETKKSQPKLWIRPTPVIQNDNDSDKHYDADDYQDGFHRFHLSSIFNEIENSVLACPTTQRTGTITFHSTVFDRYVPGSHYNSMLYLIYNILLFSCQGFC